MNKFRYCILVLALIVGSSLFAQSQKELGQLMRERNEYYFSLTVQQPSDIQSLSRLCSVDAIDGKNVICYANQQQYEKLLQAGYQPTLMTPPSMLEEAVMWDGNNRAAYEWDSYPTYDAYQSMMEGFPSQALSDRSCTLLDLGTLNSGRKILGVRLNNGQPDGKPRFLYSSTMHGDEVTGMMLMLRLIDEFCTSTDSRIVNILNNVDLFIFPLTNPDGTYYGGNSTMNSARRYNINGVDLNRNYKDYFNGDHPDGNAYALETQWTMQLAQDYLFTMSANYHGGAEVTNYPWDAVYDDHPDKDWYQLICAEYVSNARTYSSSYMTDTYSSGVTNGAAWYVITGSRQDYENAYGECREITIECSSTKKPSASTMPTYWNYNHTAMLAFIEQCINGIHGFVYDADTNEPIVGATITVLNHDNDLSKVTTHNVGDFHRPIKGGSYTLKVTKEGYCQETVNVTVADGQQVNLQVYLTPEGNCPIIPVTLNCYEQVMPSAAGDYVMGYLNGNTLKMPSHNNSSTVTTTSLEVTATDNGFSVEEESTPATVTLTAYGSNGQYYIKYNGRYLARSSFGSSLTWGTSTSQYGRWYINSNGTYIIRNNTNYYLYYDTSSNSFKLSTTQQNNIHFYVPGDCPGQSVTQTSSFTAGTNWWTPNVELDGATLLNQLETGLGANGIKIIAQNGTSATYSTYGWSGSLTALELGQMYMVQTIAPCSFTIEGNTIDMANHSITLYHGNNWMGFFGAQSMSVTSALTNLTATVGDVIIAQDGSSTTYSTYGWGGSLTTFEPGQAYIYNSKDASTKTFTFPSTRQ